jgi:putative protein kinase ArgK-like GTPase of G3E family
MKADTIAVLEADLASARKALTTCRAGLANIPERRTRFTDEPGRKEKLDQYEADYLKGIQNLERKIAAYTEAIEAVRALGKE